MDDDTDLNKRTDGTDGSKARIEPLPPIDHSTIEYKPFLKDFYSHCIPPEISSLSDELEELLRRSELHIQLYKVSRQQILRPITTFKQIVNYSTKSMHWASTIPLPYSLLPYQLYLQATI